MNYNYINELAAAAQKKFEEAKNLILQEFEVALGKAEECDDVGSAGKVVAEFINQVFGMDEPECEPECGMGCCGECCDDCEEEDIAWVNVDAIDFEKDYKEIGILIQGPKDDAKIAIEYDADMDPNSLPALMAKALTEMIWNDEAIQSAISKEEVESIIDDAIVKAILKILFKGVDNIISEAGDEE